MGPLDKNIRGMYLDTLRDGDPFLNGGLKKLADAYANPSDRGIHMFLRCMAISQLDVHPL
jgi:hypothetical protein